MNYLRTIPFLIFSLVFCYGMGKIILEKLKIQNKCFSKIFISGYLYSFAMQWIVGFPSQVLHVSWNTYYIVMLVVYAVHILFLLYYAKNKIKHYKFVQNFLTHVKQYWFIYGLVAIFTIMSMASQFSYFQHSYDDYFYLGATVQEIGAAGLGKVDYFSGMPQDLDIVRLMNTFSIQYAFMAETFRIDPVAFMRVSMVILNYIAVFMAYHAFLVEISGKEKNMQFYLGLLSVFIIPSAYLANHNIINTYDDWQLNNAIWYGSSIVRLIGLPVLLIFVKDIVDNFSYKKVIWLGLLCLAFISFSTIAIIFCILSFIVWVMYAIYQFLHTRYPKRCNWYFGIFTVCCFILFVIVLPRVLYASNATIADKMHNEVLSYEEKIDKYATTSLIMRMLFPIILIWVYKGKNKILQWYTFAITALTVIVFGGVGSYFMILAGIFFDFVALRFSTALQMLIILIFSYLVIKAIHTYAGKLTKVVPCILVAIACIFNYSHLDVYRTLRFHTSGVSEYGFSIQRLLKSDQMMPDVVVKVGAFFDQFDEKKRVLAPYQISCEDAIFNFYDSIVYSSPKASVLLKRMDVALEADRVDNGEGRMQLGAFIEQNIVSENFKELLERYEIDFIFTIDPTLGETYDWPLYETITYDEDYKIYILEV